MSKELIDVIVNMNEKGAIELVKRMLENNEDPLEILSACKGAMDTVGKRFETGEFFLPELILAGEMVRQISEIIKLRLTGELKTKRLGKIVIGTVKGDIHDIGKNIVAFMLDVNGYEVLDLGIDISPNVFVEKIKEFQPQVVGLSGFLTLAFDSMKKTVETIEQAGLRDKVKIMIGGGQVDEEVRKYTGADAYGLDAMDAVKLAKRWVMKD
jgi:methanogenic corrinoid protein MtbC1